MKSRLMIGFLIVGVLLSSAGAQENYNLQTTQSPMPIWQQQRPDSSMLHPAQTQQTSGPRAAEASSQQASDKADGAITVDVWASATSIPAESEQAQSRNLSPDFTVAALTAASRMQWTERRIENSIRNGFPVGQFWIQTDLEGIDDSLNLAAIAVMNNADRQALERLEDQDRRLRAWSDWLIDANQHLALGDYLTSSWALDNDERFQSAVACTNFLVSMLASRRLAENTSCL